MNITGNIGARHLLVLGITLAVLILTYKTALKLKQSQSHIKGNIGAKHLYRNNTY